MTLTPISYAPNGYSRPWNPLITVGLDTSETHDSTTLRLSIHPHTPTIGKVGIRRWIQHLRSNDPNFLEPQEPE